jgi:cytochrome c-type biogenesis protein CcmH/NrfG
MRPLLRLLPLTLAAVLLAGCASTPPETDTPLTQLLQRASHAYAQRNYPQARRAYTQLTKAMPNDTQFWFRLGNVELQQGAFKMAVHAYEHALKLDAGDPRTWHNLALARLRQAQAALIRATRAGAGHPGPAGPASAALSDKLSALLAAPKAQP